MATFTYDQFKQAAEESGLLGQFSQADLSLAQRNPDAGMSILQSKKDFWAATTDQEREQANQRANAARSSYGNYGGGDDGSGFYLEPLSPISFDAGKAPSYTGKYDDDISNLWEQKKNYGSYSYDLPAPTYNNRYDSTIQEIMSGITNRDKFSYDVETDPAYYAYKKAYTREGRRATEDTMGQMATMTGGMPSTAAATAAQQAGDYYASKMADKVPELYQMAYQRYLDEYSMRLSGLGAVQNAEQMDYAKYVDKLGQWNTDRSFSYNQWRDGYDMLSDTLNTAQGLDQMDYAKYMDQLGQWNTDRAFNYGQILDEIGDQTVGRQEAFSKAQLAAQYGDYSYLDDMGINTSDNNPANFDRLYNLALLAAENGNFSMLKQLGFSDADIAEMKNNWNMKLWA